MFWNPHLDSHVTKHFALRLVPATWRETGRYTVLTFTCYDFSRKKIKTDLHFLSFPDIAMTHVVETLPCGGSGGRFKNAYEILNLRALKIPTLYKNRIFQCMSKIFCVEFQRVPLKFHTKYLTHTLKDVNFIHR